MAENLTSAVRSRSTLVFCTDTNICVNDVVDDLVGKIERPSLDAYVQGETEVRIAELVRKSRNNA